MGGEGGAMKWEPVLSAPHFPVCQVFIKAYLSKQEDRTHFKFLSLICNLNLRPHGRWASIGTLVLGPTNGCVEPAVCTAVQL